MKGLFQTFALSAGMYACQVWGTAYLAPDATFMSPIEKIRLVFAKRILRVHKGCANMAVYAELGWHTYQYYYLRCMARFWNDLCDCNSSILRATMESDITLAIDGGSTACWTYGFSQALERLQPSFADDIKARRKLCVTTITRLLLDARNTYWNRLWAVNPRVDVLPDLDTILKAVACMLFMLNGSNAETIHILIIFLRVSWLLGEPVHHNFMAQLCYNNNSR